MATGLKNCYSSKIINDGNVGFVFVGGEGIQENDVLLRCTTTVFVTNKMSTGDRW